MNFIKHVASATTGWCNFFCIEEKVITINSNFATN